MPLIYRYILSVALCRAGCSRCAALHDQPLFSHHDLFSPLFTTALSHPNLRQPFYHVDSLNSTPTELPLTDQSVTMNCIERQRLLDLLTSAVAVHHPHASRTLADYIARPLTDDELELFVKFLHLSNQSKHTIKTAQAEMLQRIDRAKTQYATYLRATDKRDIRVHWLSSKDLLSFGPTYQRQHWLHVQTIYSHRYEDQTKQLDEVMGRWYTGFSVVLKSAEYKELRDITDGWPVRYKDNVSPTYAPPDSRELRLMKEIWRDMAQNLKRIHDSRFDFVPTPLNRGNEPWFPFPTCHFTAHERAFNLFQGATVQELDAWDRGNMKAVLLRGCVRAAVGEAVLLRETQLADQKVDVPLDEEQVQHADFFSGNLGGHASHQMPGTSGLPLEQPVVTGRYNRAARLPPPPELQIMAGSQPDEESSSVAVASLSLVSGNLRRMKSFVRKPSRGEALVPSADETNCLQLQQKQILEESPPGPLSSSLSLLSAQLASPQTGLETPPDSASPVKPRPVEVSNKQYKRRVTSAATKIKRKKGTPRRPSLKTGNSQDSIMSTATAPGNSPCSSLEPLTKTSTGETKLSLSCGDSPSPTNLWSQPVDAPGRQPTPRKDSGLGTFSPGRQATTSIQRVDARGQHITCAHPDFSSRSKLSSQKPRGNIINSRKDSCFSAHMAHHPLSAAQKMLTASASSPK